MPLSFPNSALRGLKIIVSLFDRAIVFLLCDQKNSYEVVNVPFDTRRCMHCASPGLQRINLKKKNYAGLEKKRSLRL